MPGPVVVQEQVEELQIETRLHFDRDATSQLLWTEDGILQLTPAGVVVVRDPDTLAFLRDIVPVTPIQRLALDSELGLVAVSAQGEVARLSLSGTLSPLGTSLGGAPLWSGQVDKKT